MADHAMFVTAAEPGLGWESGTDLASYAASRQETTDAALESSPLWPHLAELADGDERTAADLLDRLEALAGDGVTRRRGWPKRPRDLSGAIRRLAPDLRRVGIGVAFGTIGRGTHAGRPSRCPEVSRIQRPQRPQRPHWLYKAKSRGRTGSQHTKRGRRMPESGVAGGRTGSLARSPEDPVFPGLGSLGSLGSLDSGNEKVKGGLGGPETLVRRTTVLSEEDPEARLRAARRHAQLASPHSPEGAQRRAIVAELELLVAAPRQLTLDGRVAPAGGPRRAPNGRTARDPTSLPRAGASLPKRGRASCPRAPQPAVPALRRWQLRLHRQRWQRCAQAPAPTAALMRRVRAGVREPAGAAEIAEAPQDGSRSAGAGEPGRLEAGETSEPRGTEGVRPGRRRPRSSAAVGRCWDRR